MYGVAVGGKILAVGKLEACFAVGERDHLLHDALAKGGGTHDGGALMILQAAGENFAGGGGAAVDQQHQGNIVRAGAGIARIGVILRAGLGIHYQLLIQEAIGHADRIVHPTAGVVAQIQDQARGALLFQRIHRGVEIHHQRFGGELIDNHIAHVVIQHRVIDVVHVDGRAQHIKGEILAVAVHLYLHRFTHQAAHDVDGHLHGLGVDLDIGHAHQHVALAQAGGLGGGIAEYAGDGDGVIAVIAQQLDAYAGVFAFLLAPKIRPGFSVVIESVGIFQPRQQALHGHVHHGVGVGLLIVVGLDVLQHLV